MGMTNLMLSQKLCSFFLIMILHSKNSKSESALGHLISNSDSFKVKKINFYPSTAKSLHKRAISADKDDVFKQLELELNADITERILTAEEEKEESEHIFQELLEEMSGTKSVRGGNKDSESIQRITDTISRIIFRGRKTAPDNSNILRLISNVFSFRPG